MWQRAQAAKAELAINIEAAAVKAREEAARLDREYNLSDKATAAQEAISTKAAEAQASIRSTAGEAWAKREKCPEPEPEPGAGPGPEPEPEPESEPELAPSVFSHLRRGVGSAFVSLGESLAADPTPAPAHGATGSTLPSKPPMVPEIQGLPDVPITAAAPPPAYNPGLAEPLVVEAFAVPETFTTQPQVVTATAVLTASAASSLPSAPQNLRAVVTRQAAGFGLTINEAGQIVDAVTADLAGIPKGSHVVAIDGRPISGRDAILTALRGVPVGQSVDFMLAPPGAAAAAPAVTTAAGARANRQQQLMAPSAPVAGSAAAAATTTTTHLGQEIMTCSPSGQWRACVVVAERAAHGAMLGSGGVVSGAGPAVRVHYVGFNTSYDEWLELSSPRLRWEKPPAHVPQQPKPYYQQQQQQPQSQPPPQQAVGAGAAAAVATGGLMAALGTSLLGAQAMRDMQMANQLRKDLGLTPEQALKFGKQACYVAEQLGITPQNALALCQGGVHLAKEMGISPEQAARVVAQGHQQYGGVHR